MVTAIWPPQFGAYSEKHKKKSTKPFYKTEN